MAPVDLFAALDLALPGTFVDAAVPLAAITDVLRGLVMTLFVISSILVLLVVLAQEGKGGGLSGAFGGAGAETFGVKAGTVNKFTAWVATSFLGLALVYAGMGQLSRTDVEAGTTTPVFEAPAEPGGVSDPNAPSDAGAPSDEGTDNEGGDGDAGSLPPADDDAGGDAPADDPDKPDGN